MLACAGATAQSTDDVATIDRHTSRAYRQGEVIVKFKSTSPIKVSASRTGAVRSNVSLVDTVFAKLGVTVAEQLMPLVGSGGPARVKSHTGSYIERSDLSKLYSLQLGSESGVAVQEAVETLSALPEVEYAEPNYIVYALATPPGDHEDDDEKTYSKEPLYKEQWYIEAIHLNHLWKQEKINSKRPVIAILDTGVDTTHPDLADNIWSNGDEADGYENYDDDWNGYIDDQHGWDFVNQSARMRDNNGHGTHVAGIAAAVGKNGIGIAGANPDALIMPVTVMQSDGTGDVATIIKGIDYAAANGADVINMSLGTYAHSVAMEQALARAYSTAVLVAAAGNDSKNICKPCNPGNEPMFPAAFTFVLGVEATNRDGSCAGFSNFDPDGPIYSHFSEEQLYNYELRAPGVSIMSTYPGGKYKVLNGTSMSSPLVAGAISRLLQCKEYDSKELLFGDLIHARKKNDNGVVDFQTTYEIKDEERKPTLQFVTYGMYDGEAADLETGTGVQRPQSNLALPIVSTDGKEYWYKMMFANTGKNIYAPTPDVQLQAVATEYTKLEGEKNTDNNNWWRFGVASYRKDSNESEHYLSVEIRNGIDYNYPFYQDKTTSVLVAGPGAKICFTSLDVGYSSRYNSNMHSYLYIDYNKDKAFDQIANPDGTTGGELVTYSCYRTSEGHRDIWGNEVESDVHDRTFLYEDFVTRGLPVFYLPEDIAPGEYRVRLKCDYDDINPNGSINIKEHEGYICDFTLRIEGEVLETPNEEPVDEDAMHWKVVGNDIEGYSFVNKLGYTLCLNSTVTGEAVYVSATPQGVTRFNIGKPLATNVLGFELHPVTAPAVSLSMQQTGYVVIASNGILENQLRFEQLPGENYFGTGVSGNSGDGDGRADAGEIIELFPTLRNLWGYAENINISLSVAENEDPTIVEIIDTVACFGQPLSSYAKAKSDNPIRIMISDKCVDGRKIRLLLRATCDNIAEELVHEFVITVENGVEIGGVISKDLTLYPDVHYIVTKTLAVPQGLTLTIMPGTVLEFRDKTGINCEGNLVCNGTPDSLIIFNGAGAEDIDIFAAGQVIRYAQFTDFGSLSLGNYFNYSNESQIKLVDCIYNYNGQGFGNYLFERSNLCYNNELNEALNYNKEKSVHNNIIGNDIELYDDSSFGVAYDASNILTNNFKLTSYNNVEVVGNIMFHSYNIGTYYCKSYLGSAVDDIVQVGVFDMYHPVYPTSGSGYVDLGSMATRPYAEAHGIVWKVLVNGIDAQDEFKQMEPLGVGRHRFDVYFNRPMDVSIAPNIYMGVRPPYMQVAIAEDGTWSADSLVYTAYLTIDGKTASDGLNRIYVDGAKDNEHFEIPIEKHRFNVEVAAAGSMSTGLMAEAGLGKVTLTWNTDEDDFEDLLGYNVYRYTDEVDSIFLGYGYDVNWNWVEKWELKTDTLIVNESLLESSVAEFIDYNVVPGTTYYYIVKQFTTSLGSYAMSNAVAVMPLASQKGDSNGSANVDIADVVTDVAWLTGQSPQPFIFEAADVNSDTKVNILDVIGTVSMIVNPQSSAIASASATAIYTIEDGILYIESDVAIGGIQLSITAAKGAEFTPLGAITGFEQVGTWMSDSEYQFLVFSMNGRFLAPGKHAILRIGDATLGEVILSNSRGANIMAVNGNTTGIGAVEGMQMHLPYPNPFSATLTIPYIIGKEGNHKVSIVISDIAGRAVYSHVAVNSLGEYVHTWTPGAVLADGLYIVSLYVDEALMHTAKVIYKK